MIMAHGGTELKFISRIRSAGMGKEEVGMIRGLGTEQARGRGHRFYEAYKVRFMYLTNVMVSGCDQHPSIRSVTTLLSNHLEDLLPHPA